MRTHQSMSSTTTSHLHSVSIFDLSQDELRERLRPTSEAVKLKKFAKGGYFSYYDRLICPTSAHTIHEYRDRKELMSIDENGKEHFVKTL
ncbi:hypothetical protein ACVW0P_004489 [Mucilaginibacter sp. UYNi724]|jgi:hypothetical protein